MKVIRRSVFALCAGVALAIAGCRGTPSRSESLSRSRLQSVTAFYRPGGRIPPLPVLGTNSTLGDLLQYAMLNQPKIEIAYYDWAASVERISAARSLPDPQITFQMDIENIVTSIMPGLMMNFPGAGKLRAEAEVASAESQSRYFVFEASILQTALEVKRAYYQLYFLSEKIRVNQENLQLLTGLEELARAQNEVGKVTLQDVLRAQIELDRLRTEIENLQDSRNALEAQFKAALGLKAPDPVPPLSPRFESTPLDLSAEKLFDTGVAESKRLKEIEAEIRAAEASILLARKSKMPDSSLGVMADWKMSPTLYRPVASVSLPIWRDKISAQIAEAQAGKKAAQARLSAEQISLAVDFAEKTYLYREMTRSLALLENELLPKARRSLEVARSGYLSGQIDFFNVTDSERTLLGFELDKVEAATQRELILTELSLIIRGMPPSGAAMTSGARANPAVNARKRSGTGMNSMRQP